MFFGSCVSVYERAILVLIVISHLFLMIELTECRTDTLSAMTQCKNKFIYELGRYCSSNPRNRKRNIRIGPNARESDYLADLLGRPSTAEKESQNPDNQLDEENKGGLNITKGTADSNHSSGIAQRNPDLKVTAMDDPIQSPTYFSQQLGQGAQNLYQGVPQYQGFPQQYPQRSQNAEQGRGQPQQIGQYGHIAHAQGGEQGPYPPNQQFPRGQYSHQAQFIPQTQYATPVQGTPVNRIWNQNMPYRQIWGQEGLPEYNQYPPITQGIPLGGATPNLPGQQIVYPPSLVNGNTMQHTRSRRVKRMYDPDVALVAKCCRRPPGCYAEELAKLPKSFYTNICG